MRGFQIKSVSLPHKNTLRFKREFSAEHAKETDWPGTVSLAMKTDFISA
jgi:hypothetical protein